MAVTSKPTTSFSDMVMQRWKLTIEYDGAPFYGWQRQGSLPSVQQTIETAIRDFSQQDITIHAAGRTDTGVHAKGQIAHFDLDYGDRGITPFEMAKAINAHMKPYLVSILKAEIVAPDFHARFQAKNKLYTYRLLSRQGAPTYERGKVWHTHHKLDSAAMHKAAQHLVGHHDFTSFRDSACQAKSPVKTLTRLDVEEKIYDDHGGREILIHAEGRSFLHHQVRNMVGTLYLVGDGKWQPDDVRAALDAKDRAKAGPTCPPDGLYLVRIDY